MVIFYQKKVDSENYIVSTISSKILSIDINKTLINSTSTSKVTIRFSKRVFGFTLSNIRTPNASMDSIITQEEGKSYVGMFTPNLNIEDSSNFISLVGDGVKDIIGNELIMDFNSSNYVIDSKPPTVESIDFNQTYVNTNSNIKIIIKFSEEVQTFNENSIFSLNGTTSSWIKQSDKLTHIGIFTPKDNIEDNIDITVIAREIEDLAENSMISDFSIVKHSIDTKNPEVRIIRIDKEVLRTNETANLLFKFTEKILSFTVDDIISPNASIVEFTKLDDEMTYSAKLIPNNNVEDTTNKITIKKKVTDLFNNPLLTEYSSNNYSIFTIVPTILSVDLDKELIIKNETANLTIKFSKEVIFFDDSFITVESGSITQLTKLEDNLTYSAIFTPKDNIQDFSNIITVDNTGLVDKQNVAFPEDKSSANYKIDTTNPKILSIHLESNVIKKNSSITIKFSEEIKSFGISNIIAENGTIELLRTDDNKTYRGIFVPNNKVEDLTNIITVKSLGLEDLSGNPILSNLNSINYIIDTKTPRIISVKFNSNKMNITSHIEITVNFSEKVLNFSKNSIITANGSIGDLVRQSDGLSYVGVFYPDYNITDYTNIATVLSEDLTDLAKNNLLGDCNSTNYIIDTVEPEILSIELDKNIISKNGIARVTIKFNEEIKDFNSSYIKADNGIISQLVKLDDNITYSAILTPHNNIEYLENIIMINNYGLTDLLGNKVLSSLDSNNFTIDTASPKVLDFSLDKNIINKDSTAKVQIIFSEKIKNLTLDHIGVKNGSVTTLTTEDHITYNLTFTPNDNIEVLDDILTINKNSIQDINSNNILEDFNSTSFNIDTKNPEISSIELNITTIKVGETAQVIVNFSEEINGLNRNSFIASNGYISSIVKQDNNKTYIGIFTPRTNIEKINNKLIINKTGLKDLAGNIILDDLESENYSIDNINPKILSLDLNITLIKKDFQAKVIIKFSEEIRSFNLSDLIIENGSIDSLLKQDDNITYIGIFTPIDNLEKKENQITIKKENLRDLLGNPILNDLKSNNYIIDTVEPKILSIDINSSTLIKNQTAKIEIKFSKELVSFGITDINSPNGSISRLIRLSDKVTYRGTFTPTDNFEDKTNIITVKKDNLQDLSGNLILEDLISNNYIIDTKNPTIISLELNETLINKNKTAKIKIKFSEEILLFDNDSIMVQSGTANSFIKQDDNVTYIGTFTPIDDIERLKNKIVADSSYFRDIYGNPILSNLSSNNYSIDTRRPLVLALDLNISKIKKNETSKVTIIFNEEILNFNKNSLIIENGSIDSLLKQDDNLTYIGTFTPTDNLEDFNNSLTIKSLMVEDLYNNRLLEDYKSTNYSIDTTAPILESLKISSTSTHVNQTTYIQNEFIDFNVTFSEEVIVDGNSTITIEVGDKTRVANYLSRNLNTLKYQYLISPGDMDIDGISVNENQLRGKIVDNHGNTALINHSSIINDKNSLINTESTKVTISSNRTSSNPLNREDNITIEFNFDQKIINSSFTVDDINITNGVIKSLISLSNQKYEAVILPILDIDSNLSVQLMKTSIITESDNTNDNSNIFTYKIKTSIPTIINITSGTPDGFYKKDKNIILKVVFSEEVFVTGSSKIDLETGDKDAIANYDGGSGNKNLRFKYIVDFGEFTEDLNYKDLNSLKLTNDGKIKDYVGNIANVTLPLANSLYSLSGNKDISIDSTPPYIESIGISNGTIFETGNSVEVEVKFAKELIDLNLNMSNIYAKVDLETFGKTKLVKLTYKSHQTINKKTVVTFQFNVTDGMEDKNGIIIENWVSGEIKDANGNIFKTKGDKGFQFPNVISRDVLITRSKTPYLKSVEIIDSPTKETFNQGDIIKLIFSETIKANITTTNILLNNGHNFGNNFSLNYTNSNSELEIILGTNPTILANDKVTINLDSVVSNSTNRKALEDITFRINNIKMPNFDSVPIKIEDLNKNSNLG